MIARGREKIKKQLMHNCSNANSCDLGTKLCNQSHVIEVSDMSNNIKMNNVKMLNELAELDRLGEDQR